MNFVCGVEFVLLLLVSLLCLLFVCGLLGCCFWFQLPRVSSALWDDLILCLSCLVFYCCYLTLAVLWVDGLFPANHVLACGIFS